MGYILEMVLGEAHETWALKNKLIRIIGDKWIIGAMW